MTSFAAKSRGFTLLEIMAVVLIIAMIASSAVVVFASGGPQKDLDSGIEKFVGYSHQVADLSILTGEPVGLIMTPPAWTEDPSDDSGWTYTWRRYVEVPAQAVAAQQNADGGQAEQGLSEFPQPDTLVGEWFEITGLEPVPLGDDISVFVRIEGQEWDWRASTKSELPLFVLYPTGEAEPFLFEVEFAHRDTSLEPQHVELDRSGKLQWREARDKQAERERRFQ